MEDEQLEIKTQLENVFHVVKDAVKDATQAAAAAAAPNTVIAKDKKCLQKLKIQSKHIENLHYGDKNVINIYQSANVAQNVLPVTSVLSLSGSAMQEKPSSMDSFIKYRERLMNGSKTVNAYMKSLFWDDRKNDFPIKEYFVELKVQKADLLGMKSGENIGLEQIFCNPSEIHQTILVTGNPGYGKTTLCKKLAYDWGADIQCMTYLRHFFFVVVVVLRELREESVAEAVVTKIFGQYKTSILNKLRKADLNMLVILDGFDEVQDKNPVIKFIREDSFDISRQMTILITSRQHVADDIREDMDLRFSVEGFSLHQQEKYIDMVFKREKAKRESLLELLKSDIIHSGLAECPLMLHMICCLHGNGHLGKTSTMTELFIQIFRLIIKRYMKKNGKSPECFKKGKYFYGEDLLIRLGQLVHNNEQSPKIKKDPSIYNTLKDSIKNTSLAKAFPVDEEYKFILGLDVLVECSDQYGSTYFDFLHRTFLEFLIALFMYDSLSVMHFADRHYILLFLLGLQRNDPYPDIFLNNLSWRIFNSKFMLEAYKEINSKSKCRLFSSKTKVFFRLGETVELRKLMPVFQFTEIYFLLPQSSDFYEEMRRELIEFHDTYDFPYEIEILLLFENKKCDLRFGRSPKISNDICQPVALIKYLLNSYNWNKFKISFHGVVNEINYDNSAILEKSIDVFTKVETPTAESKDKSVVVVFKRSLSLSTV